MSKTRAFVASVSIVLFAGAAHAAVAPGNPLGLNSREPIAVNADSFLADLNGNTGTYTGNVIVTQGQVKLHADEVKVIAPAGRASRMEAQGHVVVDSPSGRAIADTGGGTGGHIIPALAVALRVMNSASPLTKQLRVLSEPLGHGMGC